MRQTSGPERAFATGPCFMWGFVAGLRVSELTGLLLTAVTLQPTPTLRVVGKGRKERSLPLWKQTRQTGGGALLDLASHHVDLTRFVFAQPIARVAADIGVDRCLAH